MDINNQTAGEQGAAVASNMALGFSLSMPVSASLMHATAVAVKLLRT